MIISIYIYIYAVSRRFYPKRLTLHSHYSFYILSALDIPVYRYTDRYTPVSNRIVTFFEESANIVSLGMRIDIES